MKKINKIIISLGILLTMAVITAISASAANADVAGAITNVWNGMGPQIKDIVGGVVFPILDVICGVGLFISIAAALISYHKHKEINWVVPACFFGGLLFCLTAPSYIWTVIGI
ncbi:MAG: DUF3852 domain-containing protein [Eubacterium sp.]|nr:DUF3852 domain-containing protein [Eubacterium sp.]